MIPTVINWIHSDTRDCFWTMTRFSCFHKVTFKIIQKLRQLSRHQGRIIVKHLRKSCWWFNHTLICNGLQILDPCPSKWHWPSTLKKFHGRPVLNLLKLKWAKYECPFIGVISISCDCKSQCVWIVRICIFWYCLCLLLLRLQSLNHYNRVNFWFILQMFGRWIIIAEQFFRFFQMV